MLVSGGTLRGVWDKKKKKKKKSIYIMLSSVFIVILFCDTFAYFAMNIVLLN